MLWSVLFVLGAILFVLLVKARDASAQDSTTDPGAGPAAAQKWCTVARLIDGDTFVCEDGRHVR